MCPKTPELYLCCIIGVIIIYYFAYRRIFKCVSANFDTLGTLIQSSQRVNSFYQVTLSGFYKGRRVELQCPFFDKGGSRTFFVEPLNVRAEQKLFMLEYPRPTRNTQLKGNKVFYSHRAFFNTGDDYYKIYSREELVQILEELREAAHNVETGISYKPKGHPDEK
jgi:hypothetical protein